MCYEFLYKFYPNKFRSKQEMSEIWSQICVVLHVKCQFFGQILIKFYLSSHIFDKYLNVNFHEYPFGGHRVGPFGRKEGRTHAQTDRRRDMTTLIVAFRNFSNVPKNEENRQWCVRL